MADQHLVPRQAVDLAELNRTAERLGWTADKKFNKDADRYDSGELAWRAGKHGRVILARKQAVEHDYFVVEAPDPGDLVSVLMDSFPCYTDDEIREAVAKHGPAAELIDALHLVGARAFPRYEEAIASAVERGCGHEDAQVRIAGALAASRLGWRRLRPVVERLSHDDPSEVVRDLSHNFLGLVPWDHC